jgi:beta-lactamase regulating signal transducer with metallopeptidase domain
MLSSLLWNLSLTAGLAIVLAALCRVPSLRRRPALRHWLWLLLLAKLITPPLLGVPLLPAVAGSDHTAAMAPPPSKPAADQFIQVTPASEDATFARAGRDVGAVTPEEPPGRLPALLGGLLAVSLIGTGVLWTVHGIHAVKLYRWLRRAGTENSVLAESCAEVASSMEVRRVVRSCAIDARITPLLWGWHEPLVVVPRQLVDELSPQQLRSVIAHELAHLLRRDHWANVFVFIVKGLLWWNPVVWWADRELRAAQELCCDAIAIDRCKADRRSYAKTLLKALDFIQMEPLAPRALAAGMGSSGSILRRFEMIAETRVSYQLSRWTFLALLVLAIPLVCIPVRGEEKKPAVPATPAASSAGVVTVGSVTESKKETPAKAEGAKTGDGPGTQAIDPKIRKLGEATRKRITTWTDHETLTLKDGQTGRMKVKKNATPVAEILITPHFVQNGTKFDLEGVDAAGKALEGAKTTSLAIHDAETERMGLGKLFSVNGNGILAKIQLHPTRQEGNRVAVEVKTLFTRTSTHEEIQAMLLIGGKSGQLQLNFQTISRAVLQFKEIAGHYPKDLAALKKPLPKDAYSPTGADYHYEAQRNRFILSSCGKDGIYGNADDEILITHGHGQNSGQRHELYPLEEEKPAVKATKAPQAQAEKVVGARPRGNCSIAGKVVSAAAGKPIVGARIYLFYNVTFGSIFVNTASDGTFVLKDIPTGPFSLRSSSVAGYQDAIYSPEHTLAPLYMFSLAEGEHRAGIVLKAKQACRISGKVVDEQGDMPEHVDTLTVLAWFKKGDGTGFESQQARMNREDGSYVIDGLGDKPAYVMAIDWHAAAKGDAPPPIYYPSTFSRGDAKLITFDKTRSADNINITLRKEGGLILEGTVRDDTGKPVPEAFVIVHHRDMLFDFATAYTDAQGHYQIQGLGDGEFQVHIDAVHRGLVRTRSPVDLAKANKKTQRDFTLVRGVSISGKFADEKGGGWRIGQSYGYASIVPKLAQKGRKPVPSGSFTLTGFGNKYDPGNTIRASGTSFSLGEGNYCWNGQMIFPTKGTFLIQGMMPGHTKLGFSPQKEGQHVLKILRDGQDILTSGITTKPGQEIKDVTIVIVAH